MRVMTAGDVWGEWVSFLGVGAVFYILATGSYSLLIVLFFAMLFLLNIANIIDSY